MKTKAILFLTLFFWVIQANAQKFWFNTYEFWGGPKKGITLTTDDNLLVACTGAVLRSTNEGFSWTQTLTTSELYSKAGKSDGVVLAGGRGKIFHSQNHGQTWDSITIGGEFPVIKIVFLPSGNAMAISSETTFNSYLGTGVWHFDHQSGIWTQRNLGLGGRIACDQLAVDKFGRTYLTSMDEFRTGQAGLFFTDNEGQNWTKASLNFNGQNIVGNAIHVEYTTGLSVSEDSLFLSVMGSSGGAIVRVNLRKSLSEISQNSNWKQFLIRTTPQSFWMDRLVNGIHFAKNGDRFSSTSGSTFSEAGTYFKKYGRPWHRTERGLGLDEFVNYNVQKFSEKANGKVFMIQDMDFRVYWADTSRLVTQAKPTEKIKEIIAFPNPVLDGKLRFSGIETWPIEVKCMDSQLRQIKKEWLPSKDLPMNMGVLQSGLYFIQISGFPNLIKVHVR